MSVPDVLVGCERGGLCDLIVSELLAAAGVAGPPVDAWELARALGVPVVYDADQATRGRQTRLHGTATIFVRPDERPERLQWTVAHELGESQAYRIVAEDEAGEPAVREQVANLLAARILLPSVWFWDDVGASGGDLWRLKERYRTASCELIARRLIDSPAPVVMTVCDQGRISWRRSNAGRPPQLTAVERDVWTEVRRRGEPLDVSRPPLRVQAWPVHDGAWRREVVRTTWDEGDWGL